MNDAYLGRLQRHLAWYRTEVLGVPPGTWGEPPRTYDHILRRADASLNIVEPLRERFTTEQKRRRWTLHRYFHHLSSSQALAFNLFLPFYPRVSPAATAIRGTLGILDSAPAEIDFEVVLPTGDGTNIDVLITEGTGRRIIIEVKLTESGFGRGRNDERHRQKLKERYIPLFRGRVAESLLEAEAFFRDYQLFRNIAQLRSGSNDCVVLLIPRARGDLWREATEWCARPELGAFCTYVRPVALEDVIAALKADAQSNSVDEPAVAAIAVKYLAPD